MKTLLLLVSLLMSNLITAQTKTTFHVGSNGNDTNVGVIFYNPLEKNFVSYDIQYIQRQERQFFQNSIGVAFDINNVVFTSSVFIGVEINKPVNAPINNAGLAISLRCNFWKQFGIESKLEQSRDTNLYFSLTYSLK